MAIRSPATTDARADLVAGLTVTAMLVPQAMAYALLAGLPPQVGLYASIVPVALYALFGTSRHLAVGPVAIVSLMTATVVGTLAPEGGSAALGIAALLALVVGGVHLVLGVARLGFLTRLLSHPVLVGFTAAAAIIIGLSQVRHLLGVDVARSAHAWDTVVGLAGAAGGANIATVVVALASLGGLVALRRALPALPGPLVVVAVATAASTLLDLQAAGVAVVGAIPQGLPTPTLPLPDDPGILAQVVPAAVLITLVGFMESFAVARVYARRDGGEVDANRELLALGAANVGAGLFGGYPVTGGFGRTAVQAAAGPATRRTGLVVAAGVALVVVAFTPLLANLPTATLGAIVVTAVARLVDVGEIRRVARLRRSDAVTMAVAFVATLTLGVERGIAVAVVASLVIVGARIMSPHTAVLGRLPGTDVYRNVERFPEAEVVPGLEIIRLDVSLNYMNVEFLKRRVRRLVAEASPAPRAIVIDAAGVNDVDVSALHALEDLVAELADDGIETHLADVKGPVRDVLARSQVGDHLAGRIHREVPEAVAAVLGDAPRDGAGVVGPRTDGVPGHDAPGEEEDGPRTDADDASTAPAPEATPTTTA